jgi:glycosyltransferase involved in cell wall biosynthesis
MIEKIKRKKMVSVITPASRGIKELSQLLRDFRNQTLKKKFFEHIIIYDGSIPLDVKKLMDEHKNDYNITFVSIKKDTGDMRIAPGTKPRNYGLSLAKKYFVIFADDDDRYKDTFLESAIWGLNENMISVVQMSCSEARIQKNGDPTRIRLVPEAGLPYFPIICHVGTPCFAIPTSWALDNPWQDEPEHDYRFIKRIVDRYNPQIRFTGGLSVDVDGLVTRGIVDWVSKPPFYRGE